MAIPHVVLFSGTNCTGGHFHVFEAKSNLASVFSDVTSSFVILEGNWQFFVDANFESQMRPRSRPDSRPRDLRFDRGQYGARPWHKRQTVLAKACLKTSPDLSAGLCFGHPAPPRGPRALIARRSQAAAALLELLRSRGPGDISEH